MLTLVWEFFKTGLFAVGGGLATIPFLRELGLKHGWFTESALAEMIAVSQALPGPVGVNMSAYAGFTAAGILGAVAAALALVTPSVIVICIIARFMKRFRENKTFANIFYALRPAGVGLVMAAIIPLVLNAAGGFSAGAGMGFAGYGIYAGFVALCFLTEKMKRVHPLYIIVLGGICGALLRN